MLRQILYLVYGHAFLNGQIKTWKNEQNYKICSKSTKNNGKSEGISEHDPNNNWNWSINFKSRNLK